MNKIVNYLDKLIPNPVCELTYEKDYELLIKVMLSAQTTDKRVNIVAKQLFLQYPNLNSLKEANLKDLENIIRPLGTFNRKALNIKKIATILIDVYDGKIINNREALESLPGIGRKSANVLLSNLFNENCLAVDTHVARVSNRLGLSKSKDPLVIETDLTKKFQNYDLARLHHQLVLFGRYYCKAKKPLCETCKLKEICKKDSQE